jgi:hypothetical protein
MLINQLSIPGTGAGVKAITNYLRYPQLPTGQNSDLAMDNHGAYIVMLCRGL